MSSFLYFAYGSNMLTERLVARCPGARPVGPGQLADHHVSFCLKASDGSGKAGIVSEQGSTAWGIIYEIPDAELQILDRFEGVPDVYARENITLQDARSQPVSAVTYRPQPAYVAQDLQPFDWYYALCVGGARRHGLHLDLIERLARSPHQPSLAERAQMAGYQPALDALLAAGLADPHGNILL